MKRRTLLGAIGLLGSGAAFTVGSGAFGFVRTERDLTVAVEHDNDAYLSLRQLGSGQRSIEDSTPETVQFRFPGSQEAIDDPDLGLGSNSMYEFEFDSEEDDVRGLLRVANQGTTAIDVYSEFDSDSELNIELFDVTDPDKTALRDDPVTLTPLEDTVDLGFRIETFDVESDRYDETLTIVADE